ncbi:hypothetical protein ACS0TY_033993 [Phlomoides rotata]
MGDYWGEGVSLREKFGRLFRLSEQKETCISEAGKWVNGTWEWDLKWCRPLSSRHLTSYNELLVYLGRFKLLEGGADFWKWRHSPTGRYTTSSAYKLLQSREQPVGMEISKNGVYKKLWKSWATKKAVITAWKIIKERMATTDNLARRGIEINEEAKTCQLCKE